MLSAYIDSEGFLATAFSNSFVACCNTCKKRNIPYLYCDTVALKLQRLSDIELLNEVKFVTLPALCFHTLDIKPKELSAALYGLLRHCEFVSFNVDTIIQTIVLNEYNVTPELLAPFMCCNTDCNMSSFATVYLGAIYALSLTHHDEAVQLAEIVLQNTKQIWKRGTYYRIASEKYEDPTSKDKADSIKQYAKSIVKGIKQVLTTLPPEIAILISEISALMNQEE